MNPAASQEVSRDAYLAIDKLSQLGITNIVVVDDTTANTLASEVLRVAIQKQGLQLDVYSGVQEFSAGISQLNAKGHTLVLTDYHMPCEREFAKRKNAGGMAVIDICVEHEALGKLNYPIVISHVGQGHTGQMVDICHGAGNIQISDFESGKADPKFWDCAIVEIAKFLTEAGQAKTHWEVRSRINNLAPYRPSAIAEDSFKIGYITVAMVRSQD